MGYLKGLMALLVITIIWTGFLFSNPFGWYRLYIALRAWSNPDKFAKSAMDRWEKDDEIINRILFGLKDHTISGRAGYGAISTDDNWHKVVQYVVDKLFWFQPYHCFNSINWSLFSKSSEEHFKKLHKDKFKYVE